MREFEKSQSHRRIAAAVSHIVESLHDVYMASTPLTTHSEILDKLSDGDPAFDTEKLTAMLAAILRLRGADSEESLKKELLNLAEVLQAKNEKYGGSALYPMRYMSSVSVDDGLCVRIDDKISRIYEDPTAFGEDAWFDLAGYLLLLYVERRASDY